MQIRPFHLTKLLGKELGKDAPSVLEWLSSIDKEALSKYVVDLPVAEKIAADNNEEKKAMKDLVGEEFAGYKEDLLLATLYLMNLKEGKQEDIDLENVDFTPDFILKLSTREMGVRVILRLEHEERDLIGRKEHLETMLQSPSLSDKEKGGIHKVLKLMEDGFYSFTKKHDFHALQVTTFFREVLLGCYESKVTRDYVMDEIFNIFKKPALTDADGPVH